jgi:hypothetical protein
VAVLGEGREIAAGGGVFRDAFAGYAVRLCRYPTSRWLALPCSLR